MSRWCFISLILVLALAGCTPVPGATPAPAGGPVTAPAAPSPTAPGASTGGSPPSPSPAQPAPGPTATAPATAMPVPTDTARPAPGASVTAAAGTTPTAQPPAAPLATPSPASSPAAALVPAGVALQSVGEGMTAPVALVPVPDQSGRLFVVDQAGLIRIIGSDGKLLPDPFLDLRDRMVQLGASYDERGLLGLAFHPDFAHNQRFFVYYTAPLRAGGPAGYDNTEHLAEFKVAADNPNRGDPNTERIILAVDHPQPNHNGGTLVFGPDGFLYVSIGDGGGANDANNGHTPQLGNGQDTAKLLGKILRIDVNSGDPYGIPPDNPFAGGGGAAEVYAFGLRNPYRFSFDLGGTHQLFAADVGQNLYEEVDIITKGGNYGWHLKEGFHCFSASSPSQPPATCAQTGARGEPLIDPILEYSHPDPGIAIIGGYIYRGRALPGLAGRYVFGDWSSSFGAPDGVLLVAQAPDGGQGTWTFQKLAVAGTAGGRLGHYLLGLGQDANGELYALTSDRPGPAGTTGQVFKIVPGQ